MVRSRLHSEYGGGPGEPRRLSDGSSKPLTAAERRRITAMSMKRDLPSNVTPRVVYATDGAGTREIGPFAPDVEAIADLKAKTNGYSAEMSGDDFGETQ